MGCIQSSSNEAKSGGRPQAYTAPAGVEADARRDGVQQAAHAGSSMPVTTTPGQQQPAAPASTSAEQQPAAGASEAAHVSPQVNMARALSPGPLVAVESQSSTKRGSTDFQWTKSSLADMPLMSGVQNSRMDSLALLQKVLHVGVSDAAVHTQAYGLKHIGFGPLKKENQDEFYIQIGNFGGQPHGNCFCVFDGHGVHGARVSAYCQKELPKVLDAALRKYNEEEPPGSANHLRMMEDIKGIIKQSFVTTEKSLRESGLNISSSGTTASVVYQLGAQVWVAAVGDSRVVAIRRVSSKMVAQPLTLDHRPSRNSEKARVVAAGGRVEPKKLPTGRTVGEDRLWLQDIPTPGLLLSRSIGDDMASSIGCTAEPEVIFLRLQPLVDASLIMATDGIWDVLSNDEVCQLVSQSDSPEDACDSLLDKALEVWEDRLAADNISTVVIKFLWNDDGIGTL